ncbi:hypothetical protein Dimus_009460 [Dionaea muscipula]
MPPQNPQRRRSPPPNESIRLRPILIALLSLITVVGLIILITWLALRPKKLVHSIEEAFISGFNLTNDHLDSTFNLAISVANINARVSVYHDTMEVGVSYGGQTVAYQQLEPFFQHHKNVTRLNAKPTSKHVALPKNTASDLSHNHEAGEVSVDVRIKSRIRFKVGVIKSRHHTLTANCSGVLINFFSPDKFKTVKCKVKVH